MSITSAVVLFAVLWFLVLFIVLPIRMKSQAEDGNIVPGTHAGAPADPQLGKRARIVTLVAAALWCLISGIVVFGGFTVHDLDWFQRMGHSTPPASTPDDTGG